MAKKPKKVEVKWIDSAGTSGWMNHGVVPDGPVRCWTTGYLIQHTEKHVTVALNWHEGQHGDLITIPCVAVKRIRQLR